MGRGFRGRLEAEPGLIPAPAGYSASAAGSCTTFTEARCLMAPVVTKIKPTFPEIILLPNGDPQGCEEHYRGASSSSSGKWGMGTSVDG